MSLIRTSPPRALAAAAAAVALTALALPAASAAPGSSPGADAQATASLRLTILPDRPTDTNPTTTVTLECGPAGGTHPDPEHACKALGEVDGVFGDLEWADACPEYWDPVTVIATGTWDGSEEILFADRHPNRICAGAATGLVFAF